MSNRAKETIVNMIMSSKNVGADLKTRDYFMGNPDPIRYSQEFIGSPQWYKGKRATFQSAMKIIILVGQCFGLNPVKGVTQIDTNKLRFSLYSFRSVYSIISILGQCVFSFLCFLKSIKDTDSSLSTNTSLIFYTTNSITTLLFFRIAIKWPALSQLISRIESSDPLTDNKLVAKCNLSCFIILCLALLEHILADLSGIAGSLDCHADKDLYESFSTNSFPWIFVFLPYNKVFGVISQIVNIQCTFNWNFADVFVICVSLYLTSILEQVNKRIVVNRGKVMTAAFWRTMREDYTRATYLVRQVDDVIGGVVFISFANNLYFICLQWLHILRPLQGYEQAVYFTYSFVFLVTRSIAVSMIASRVHTASKEPANALYEVPSEAYCVEVQRFLDQIHRGTVALSGLQFFNVKRGMVLSVQRFLDQIHRGTVALSGLQFFNVKRGMVLSIAGTIVTYELVLIQFTGI